MYRFDPSAETIGETLRQIALSQIAAAQAAGGNDLPARRTALLEARRRTKKLRGLLRLVRPGFAAFDKENAALRDASAPLSALRDDEMLVQTVAALAMSLPDPALDRIVATLRLEQPAASDSAARLAGFSATMADLASRVPFWQVTPDRPGVLFRGLRRGYRACRKAMIAAIDTTDDERLHEWRKTLKTHAFHLMLLRRAAPEVMAARHGVIDRLGDLLGLHHDIGVLVMRATATPDRFGSREDVSRLTALATVRLKELEGAAFALGRQALAEKPRAFARRIRSHWESVKAAPVAAQTSG